MSNINELLRDLIGIGVFKTGEFLLKSGVLSPIYIDLRQVISHPKIVSDIVETINSTIQIGKLNKFDVVCGVPYTAIPFATGLSLSRQIPLVLTRKEAKSHGTKKMVEGNWKQNDICLIIEDIVSSGSSVIETANLLRKEGLTVTTCVAIVDREQGARQNLKSAGIELFSVTTLKQLFSAYCEINCCQESLVKQVIQYLEDETYIPIVKKVANKLPFEEREKNCHNVVVKNLFKIMCTKKTNLCVALDVTISSKLLDLAEIVGPHVCMVKTHINMLSDFNPSVTESLQEIALKNNFLIFEDQKFGDIGNTVQKQYSKGIYLIEEWAHLVSAHSVSGPGILQALKSGTDKANRGCVLVAEMSSSGNLADDHYQKKTVEMAKDSDFVIGFVTQHKLTEDPSLLHFCPGVNALETGDSLGQQYKTPEKAIENGADVIIVGRGIVESPNPGLAAEEYKIRCFAAYQAQVNLSS